MAAEIKMPQLSDTMSAGKILRWNKKPGDTIQRGDILAEVETEKANLEIESFHSGTLLAILVNEQDKATVGEVIAYIGAAGEAVPAKGAAPAVSKVETAPAASRVESTQAVSSVESTPSTIPSFASHDRVKASPLARKVAADRNIDLSVLHGSGPSGRITRKDVEEFRGAGPQSAPTHQTQHTSQAATQTNTVSVVRETPRPSSPPVPAEGRLSPFSPMREVIAKRMQESVSQSPHFYSTISINMEQVTKLREVLKEKPEFKGISVNHLVIKAAAYALYNEPRVNRAVRDNMIYEPGQINIGIITALDDGLLIPVIRAVDQLSLKDLVFEARAAVDRAKAGRPTSSDLSGGTFSISNMGMFDVENFTAIINPGQGAVLAVSRVRDVAVVRAGQIVPGKEMKVTLSVDHRVIDGIMSASFLKSFKEGLENPALLMVPCL